MAQYRSRRFVSGISLGKLLAFSPYTAPLSGIRDPHSGAWLSRALCACVATVLLFVATCVRAQTEPLFETLELAGKAGLGVSIQTSTSPYAGASQIVDLLPIYVYEGDYFYLHSYRAGFRFPALQNGTVEAFIAHRFEGFPYDETPASLSGMESRNPGLDGGIAFRYHHPIGDFVVELRNDISNESNGTEIRAGYGYRWQDGPLALHPYMTLAFRDTDLNNYYYGVRADEQTPQRPEYVAGNGYDFEFGLYGQYNLTRRWKMLAGIGAERLSTEIRNSPIVDKSWLVSGYVGAVYDFEDEQTLWARGKPILVRLFYGASTNCELNQIITFRCTSISTGDDSRITGVHLGRTFVERVNGWPLDFVGYAGALYRNDNGFQENSWQIDAYMKPYWYGFPWSETLRTRIGFGIGLSYASRVPYIEERDRTEGENTSKLLNYLDPSIEINLGDLFRSARFEPTWLGVGVSHRSGAFGSSQLLGNVDGGSNYIYLSVESSF
jgi:outer membrane protein